MSLSPLNRRPQSIPSSPVLTELVNEGMCALPHALTPLIGRQREIAAVTALLHQDDIRLITLTGPGGIGKSRLALQVATGLQADFADGAAFVPLAATSDPRKVTAAIGEALGVHERQGHAIADAVRRFLHGRHLLLVLDNFEHLLPAAPQVTDLLLTSPRLKILVTSRARLHLGGEQLFDVPPMSLPQPDPGLTPVDLLESESAALFVHHARAVNQDFALAPDNVPVIAELCRRLDGLPLAIELAAARSRTLSPTELLARLTQRLRLLVTDRHDVPPRLRAIRSAIDWSYDLLSLREQALFRRVAVFTGGFSLEAAIAVADTDDDMAVVDGVESLLDNSLVQHETHTEGEARFFMLETIRAYGLEALEREGEAERAHQLHAGWCVNLAERTPLALMGAADARAYAGLDREHNNLRAALAWTLAHGEPESCLRIANAIWSFWHHRGHLAEGSEWLDQALAAAVDVAPQLRVRALLGRAFLAYAQGDLQLSTSYARRSREMYREIGKPVGVGFSLLCLALVAEGQDEDDTAIHHLNEALELFREQEHHFFEAHVLMTIGRLAYKQGDRDHAAACYEEALALQRQLGNRMSTALTLDALGELAHGQGDQALALERYREALTLWRELDHPWGYAEALAGIATIAAHQGLWELAARLCGAVAARCESVNVVLPPVAQREYEKTIVAVTAAIGDQQAKRAWRVGRTRSAAEIVADIASVETTVERGRSSRASRADDADPDGVLTARELEVLEQLVAGRTNQEIADVLFISVPTVKVHVTHILRKLNVSSRTALVAQELGHDRA